MTPISLKANWQGASVGIKGDTLYAADLNNNFNAIQQAINNLIGATAASGDLNVNSVTTAAGITVGGSLAVTGSATLGSDPIAALGAATKQYVDARDAVVAAAATAQISPVSTAAAAAQATANAALPKAGGTLTGALTLAGPPTIGLHAADKSYVDAAVAGGSSGLAVLKAGDTMTGPLILSGDPTTALGAGTKQYTDAGVASATSLAAAALARSGGTMTGAITLSGDPASALQPATKQYADGQFAQVGLRLIQTQTVTAVTSVVFSLPSQYATFKLILSGIARTGGAASSLGLQGSSNGGASYIASYTAAGVFNSPTNAASAFSIAGPGNTIVIIFSDYNSANQVFAEVELTLASGVMHVKSYASGAKDNAGVPYFCVQNIASIGGSGTMDHIRLLWDDSGSFSATGKMSLYGYLP